MTVLTPPGYVQGGTYTAKLDRMYVNTAAAFPDLTQAFSARQGFFVGRVPAFANPSGMNVTVGACAGTIQNTFASASGDYRFVNDATVQVTLAAASATQNRIDVVGFQVKDNIFDSSGLNTIVPAVIQGANSAGTPAAPSLPASFIPVVQYTINASATSPTSPVSRIVRTTNDGGLLGVASATERAAIGAVDGMQIWRMDRDWVEIYDGTAWRVQGIAVCSSAADRSAAVTNPANGTRSYLSDTGLYYTFDGTVWIPDTVVAGRIVSQAGFIATGIGASEVNLAKLAIEDYRIKANYFYVFHLNLFWNFATVSAGDSYVVRIRKDTALSGTILHEFVARPVDASPFDESETFVMPWKATAADTDADFYVSVIRVAGTGTISVNGDRRTAFWIDNKGADTSLWSEVA